MLAAVSLLLVVALVAAWWRYRVVREKRVVARDGRVPVYCLVCGFHRVAIMHGYVPADSRPKDHDCVEESAA